MGPTIFDPQEVPSLPVQLRAYIPWHKWPRIEFVDCERTILHGRVRHMHEQSAHIGQWHDATWIVNSHDKYIHADALQTQLSREMPPELDAY
jgi:hypothetical protein